MNQYQRIGTFLLRLMAVIAWIIGVLGGIYAVVVRIGVEASSPSRPPSAWWSVAWLATGIGLAASANLLGRWLGRGLD
jgi:uncharacterized membrane protein YagU involved in acid resistance